LNRTFQVRDRVGLLALPERRDPCVVMRLRVIGIELHRFLQRFDPEALSDEDTLDGVIDFCLSGVLARSEPQR